MRLGAEEASWKITQNAASPLCSQGEQAINFDTPERGIYTKIHSLYSTLRIHRQMIFKLHDPHQPQNLIPIFPFPLSLCLSLCFCRVRPFSRWLTKHTASEKANHLLSTHSSSQEQMNRRIVTIFKCVWRFRLCSPSYLLLHPSLAGRPIPGMPRGWRKTYPESLKHCIAIGTELNHSVEHLGTVKHPVWKPSGQRVWVMTLFRHLTASAGGSLAVADPDKQMRDITCLSSASPAPRC